MEALIVRIARENPRMGYDKIQGELLKLGVKIHPSTVKNILHRHNLLPAPQRGCSSWRTFLKHYWQQMLACDFFTVETVRLETLYVLFFIELGSRRVHLAGCTINPDRAWVTQQARQLVWCLDDGAKLPYASSSMTATVNLLTVSTKSSSPKALKWFVRRFEHRKPMA